MFEEGRKAKAVSTSACPSQEELLVAKLESALEEKKLEPQTLPGFASECSTLRAEASPLKGFVEILGREKKKLVMLSKDV